MLRKTSAGLLFLVSFFIFNNTVRADDSIPIHLRLEAPNTTIFDADISVLPCQATSTAATSTNSFCAIEQANLNTSWIWYDFGAMLNSVNDFSATSSLYWSWFSNLEPGQTSLDSHILTTDEHLLLTFSVNPLKVEVSSSTILAGATSTISIFGFGYDSNWSPVWNPVSSSTISLSGESFTVASSTYDFSTTTPGNYSIKFSAENFAPTEIFTISVLENTATTSTTTNSGNNGNAGGNTGGGNQNNNPPPSFDTEKAYQFLIAQQKDNGSWGADLYTDWVAIALGANSSHITERQKISDYLKSSAISSNVITDYERRAMALMSLGINPYSGTSVDYIKKITDSFDGIQIGDASLINDDIFSLFPLLKSGYTTSDNIIQKTVANILANQSPNGSWGSIDLTAAALQALADAQSLNNVPQSIAKAKQYLKSVEGGGGFGTSFATSWTIQAISSLGETNEMWLQGNDSPLSYLARLQDTDGGVELPSADTNTRIWATAYAIPASLGKSWPSILSSFPKPTQTQNNSSVSVGSSGSNTTTNIATSTTFSNHSSSTPAIATSSVVKKAVSIPAQTKQISKPTIQPDVVEEKSVDTAKSSEEKIVLPPQVAAVNSANTPIPYKTLASILALGMISFGIYRYYRRK